MLISDWSSDVCSSYLRTGDAGSFELRPGAVDPLAACGRTPGGRVLDMVLMVAANEDDIVPAGGIVEPPARYENILEAAIEEVAAIIRSEEHTSELQSLIRISSAVFCLKKTNHQNKHNTPH